MSRVFEDPIVGFCDGRWRVHSERAIEMLCIYYFEEHANNFETKFACCAAGPFEALDKGEIFVDYAQVVQDTT